MPLDRVVRFENPVILVGEVDESARDSLAKMVVSISVQESCILNP